MPARHAIATEGAPKAIGPYSQAVRVGNLLFCSGQIPLDPATGEMVTGDIATQTHRVFANLAAVLAAAGVGFDAVARTTVYLADMADFAAMNAEWETWVVPGHTPPRATVQAALARPEWKIEIVVTAAA